MSTSIKSPPSPMSGSAGNRLIESVLARSQSEIVELTYEYRVPDSYLLHQKSGECLFSPVFHAKSQPGIQWRLRIYPKGSRNSKGNLGLFLERVNMSEKDQPVTVKLRFTLLRNDKPIFFIWSVPHTIASLHEGLGWNDLVTHDQLKIENNNTKQKVELKILCHLICETQRNWITSYARLYKSCTYILSCFLILIFFFFFLKYIGRQKRLSIKQKRSRWLYLTTTGL